LEAARASIEAEDIANLEHGIESDLDLDLNLDLDNLDEQPVDMFSIPSVIADQSRRGKDRGQGQVNEENPSGSVSLVRVRSKSQLPGSLPSMP